MFLFFSDAGDVSGKREGHLTAIKHNVLSIKYLLSNFLESIQPFFIN